MLASASDAPFFISEFPLHFNHLHDNDISVTAASPVSASAGAAVDVRNRMDAGSAGG
jgi:hypothetical protein